MFMFIYTVIQIFCFVMLCYYLRLRKAVMFLPVFVCLSVCLFVCLSVCSLDYSRSYEQILTKFFGGVGLAKLTIN